jgi:isopenicillin-N N-acyltransferase-like protein
MHPAPLHVVEVRGNSRQRGFQHGSRMRAPIETALEFYRSFFHSRVGLDPAAMRMRASQFIAPTHRLSPLLLDEYEGIAEGSRQTIEDIFALSARYEITFEAVALGECSNVFVGPKRSRTGGVLLGQNWDWRPEAMDFRAVIVARCDDMPDHIVVTECGQPGKYGLNECGLGVLAAGLCCEANASTGVHLAVALSRHILAQVHFAAAQRVLQSAASRATVNFLVSDAEGNAIDVEMASRAVQSTPLYPGEVYWHTNHCRIVDEPCTFENSLIRGRRWTELTSTRDAIDVRTVQSWLSDARNGSNAICKIRDDADAAATTWLQTLCSIVMDLEASTVWVSDGPSSLRPYSRFGLESASDER